MRSAPRGRSPRDLFHDSRPRVESVDFEKFCSSTAFGGNRQKPCATWPVAAAVSGVTPMVHISTSRVVVSIREFGRASLMSTHSFILWSEPVILSMEISDDVAVVHCKFTTKSPTKPPTIDKRINVAIVYGRVK